MAREGDPVAELYQPSFVPGVQFALSCECFGRLNSAIWQNHIHTNTRVQNMSYAIYCGFDRTFFLSRRAAKGLRLHCLQHSRQFSQNFGTCGGH